MKPWEIIAELERTSSRKKKEEILTSILLYSKDEQDVFWQGIKLALDPFEIFNIKQIPIATVDGEGFTFKQFCDEIEEMNVGSTRKKPFIAQLMNNSKKDEWNYWYRRILLKDLKCGMSEVTVNKIKKDLIPVFGCQLAKDSTPYFNKLRGKKILDYKLDGVRALVYVPPIYERNTAAVFSRNGKQLVNFSILNDLLYPVPTLSAGFYLDGEITSQSFQSLMTQVNRKKNVDIKDIVYNIFDVISRDEFLNGFTTPMHMRKKNAQDFYNAHLSQSSYFKLVPNVVVDMSTEKGKEEYDEFLASAFDQNYEGIIIKDYDAPYEIGKTKAWLKVKANLTVDLTVVKVERGEEGKYSNTTGSLLCEGTHDGKFISVSVGGGLSDELRDDIWQKQDKVVGMIVEIKADSISKAEDKEHYSLRFPRLVRFRGFNKGEKL